MIERFSTIGRVHGACVVEKECVSTGGRVGSADCVLLAGCISSERTVTVAVFSMPVVILNSAFSPSAVFKLG
jgi:hypothetical protein